MMRRLLLLIALLFGLNHLLPQIVSAQATASPLPALPAKMNLGFLSADSSAVPQAVRDQAKFIYRISLPYYAAVSASEYAGLVTSTGLPVGGRADLANCAAAHLASCAVEIGNIRGTAFLDRSGAAVWTNCHLVNTWIEHQKQILKLKGTPDTDVLKKILLSPLPMAMTDINGKDLFSDGAALLLSAFASDQGLKADVLACSLEDDAVKIKLPVALASSGISWSHDSQLAADQILYVGGNPRPTSDRVIFGKADSPGDRLVWSSGPAIARGPDLVTYFSGHVDPSLIFMSPYYQALAADGDEGSSGSPVFNPQGELVGIYKGTLPINDQFEDIPLVSSYLDVDELYFVESYAENF